MWYGKAAICCFALSFLAVGRGVAEEGGPKAADSGQKALVHQGQLSMSLCAEIWTIKTHEALALERDRIKDLLAKWREYYERRVYDYPSMIAERKAEMAKLTKAVDDSLAKTIEDAAKTGLEIRHDNAKEIVQAFKSNAANDEARNQLHEAEAKLAEYKAKHAYSKAFIAGLPAVVTAVEACLSEQKAYIDKQEPQKPATTSAKMEGTWRVKCVDKVDDSSFDFDGTFSLTFSMSADNTGRSKVSGTLKLGEDSSALSGTWSPQDKSLTAGSSISGETWSFAGTILEQAGQLISTGVVSDSGSHDFKCTGTYNGKQIN
jgi:hypothetical protein